VCICILYNHNTFYDVIYSAVRHVQVKSDRQRFFQDEVSRAEISRVTVTARGTHARRIELKRITESEIERDSDLRDDYLQSTLLCMSASSLSAIQGLVQPVLCMKSFSLF
jgi:hypothetical protein